MSFNTAVTTALQVAEKNDANVVLQFLLVCTVLVLLAMVYRAWNAMLAPQKPLITRSGTKAKSKREGMGRRR
ncbi:hypothetical protein [Corallococcus exiguus]|uniref:hypothetical protein n=1 Tax=Corallococcus exiguus TaxID=83462 RepID=UPI0015611832|nr:hypothetical protein [Corallococcus exiguus]NRD46706.1 hypothetical protein [Corallococcus exiguus]